MILKIGDWEFDIDMERTMAYSAAEAAEHCDCAYCRNFYTAVDEDCPALRPMLAQFGIDVEAPDALYPYDSYLDRVCYEGEYVVFGRILRQGKHHICVSDSCDFYIWPKMESEYDIAEPHFVLSLEEAQIRWVLDEPFQEVISPANEPSFLKKMWDRLLRKAPQGNAQS